jgi:hypothetical protein
MNSNDDFWDKRYLLIVLLNILYIAVFYLVTKSYLL